MPRPHRFKSPALKHLFDRYVGDDPERRAQYAESVESARIGARIYELRVQAGLSQAQLAARVGTSRSVISRIEDADYSGHSLTMLRRVARALGKVVEVRFVQGAKVPASARRKRRIA